VSDGSQPGAPGRLGGAFSVKLQRVHRHRLRWALGAVLLALPAAALEGGGQESAAGERLVWPGAVHALEEQLASDQAEVRRGAAADLSRLPVSVQRRLLPQLFADPDAEVRLAVADAALAIRLPGAGARVGKWLSDSDARVREAAAEVLRVLRDPSSVPGLGRALEDSDVSVRKAAALALGSSGSSEATSFLLGHLDDGDPDVRRAVIMALEELRDPRAVVPLIGRIQEQRAALRRQAASALGALGDGRAIGALTVALGDADASVRAAAATALGKLAATEAVWSLGSVLASESDPRVQEAALGALGAIGTPAAVDAILRVPLGPRLQRDPVQHALVSAGDVALARLEGCVFQPPQPEAGEVCGAALGAIGGSGASSVLERALRQGALAPSNALGALGQAGDTAALPTVLEYLSSTSAAERRAAVDAAGRLLDPRREAGLAVEPIARAVERAPESRLERVALVGLLGRTGSPRAAPALVAAAGAGDEYTRVVALAALGEIGRAGADATLLAGLDAVAFPERYTAALALRRVGTRSSLEPLLERYGAASSLERELLATAMAGPLADDPTDEAVARVAAHVTEALGGASDALIEALAHVPGARGESALERLRPALGKAGRAKLAESLAGRSNARATLAALLADPDANVRANAAWALASAGGPPDLPPLGVAVRDADVNVAANAVAALASIAAREHADVSASLCAALTDERAYVLANALTGLRIARGSCPSSEPALWLLEQHASEEVRIAAGRLLREHWTEVGPGALGRCASQDPSGRVALACAAATSTDPLEPAVPDVSVLVVATGETTPAAEAPFSLVRADGLIRSGKSDRRGSVWEAAAPRGPMRLTVPAVFAD
jgi:HEAT repeat protein